MKRRIKILTVFIFLMVILYLGISFILLELNPLEWKENVRTTYTVIFIITLLGFILGISLDNEDKFTKHEVIHVTKKMDNDLISSKFILELRRKLEKYAREREEDDIEQV